MLSAAVTSSIFALVAGVLTLTGRAGAASSTLLALLVHGLPARHGLLARQRVAP